VPALVDCCQFGGPFFGFDPSQPMCDLTTRKIGKMKTKYQLMCQPNKNRIANPNTSRAASIKATLKMKDCQFHPFMPVLPH
jgi:hypothetical protein